MYLIIIDYPPNVSIIYFYISYLLFLYIIINPISIFLTSNYISHLSF